LDALGRLQDEVDKGLDEGEISSEDAQRLDDAIRALATAIGPNDG
jgi:hypothetical protein